MTKNQMAPRSVDVAEATTKQGFAPLASYTIARSFGFYVHQHYHNIREVEQPPLKEYVISVQTGVGSRYFCRADGRRSSLSHQRGSMIIIPANQPAYWEFENESSYYHLCFAPALLDNLAQGYGNVLRGAVEFNSFNSTFDPVVTNFAGILRNELLAGCPSGRLFGEGIATALAAHLLAHHAVFPVDPQEYKRGLSKRDLKRVLEYVNDNLADDTSLETLAGVVAISPSHFCALFKRSVGTSPHSYVIQQRVARAKDLLVRGGQSIADVASEVGFADQAHLTRHMKKLLGATPRDVAKAKNDLPK